MPKKVVPPMPVLSERDQRVRREALVGPRSLKDSNSEEYAWQTIRWLRTLHDGLEAEHALWEKALREAEADRIYEHVPPGKPYGSLDALLQAELGVTLQAGGGGA